MTREEALEVIKEYRDNLIISPSNQLDGDVKAFDMAIQALSQEPCDDAISRDAVIDGLKGCICDEWVKTLFATMVKQLPSVTQKSGKWQRVSIDKYIQHAMAYYECSECGGQTIGEPKFCSNCGAKMESEGKE